MTGMLALGGLFLAGFAFVSLILAAMLFFVKSVFWLVLLPLRLLSWAFGAVVLFVGTAVAIAAGLVLALALILAPLLPLIVVGALFYGIFRLIKRPAMA